MAAMLFAIVAFSIDGMLPSLPEIAAELTPDDPNRAQLIVTSYVFGMGVGTLFAGPISDTFGRKPSILFGIALYCAGSAMASIAPTLDLLLAARVLQGLGAAWPRVVTLAMIRDMYSGREMARIVSFAMMTFMLVPALAPSVGTLVIALFGWRGMFAAVIVFALVAGGWMVIRREETLPPEKRKPLRLRPLYIAFREVLSHRVVVTVTLVQTLVYGAMFGTLSSTQPVFEITFGRGASFPFWFAVIALGSSLANLVNATLVLRLGMRLLVTLALGVQVVFSTGMSIAMEFNLLPDWLTFPLYVAWTASVFMTATFSIGNLNALALEPLGHIAGMAASVNGCIATVIAVLIAAPIGLAFDGTPVPLQASVAVLIVAAFALMRTLPRDH